VEGHLRAQQAETTQETASGARRGAPDRSTWRLPHTRKGDGGPGVKSLWLVMARLRYFALTVWHLHPHGVVYDLWGTACFKSQKESAE